MKLQKCRNAAILAVLVLLAGVVEAKDIDEAEAQPVILGPVTRLPLPRFVSLKADTGNVRRGPSLTHRVDWVFQREDMPLEITAEFGNWRRVRDMDGAGGWMHYTLLSGVRTVVVLKDYTPFRVRPEVGADPVAYAEHGVVAFLEKCLPDWCKISADGNAGWALKTEIWGVTASEVSE